ncbi:hypothetical protein CAC42_6441 [Sphaceloma murrayae]|uniref:Autophagy-related protein n=1 Tax=Sphaceloma murrayae TaxID=2082308 RepID=A0A2K1QMF6_9PEZI|nr:hypothetical protein CAC42_6441 [Sphaceloma murrayae]
MRCAEDTSGFIAAGAEVHATSAGLDEHDALLGLVHDPADQPTVTRRELWSYYFYYNGDNGVGPQSYSLAIFQSALTAAGHDPSISPPQVGNCGTGSCVIPWGSGTCNVNSVILLANGLCFAIMTLVFLCLGSAADYGDLGPRLLLYLTVTCWMAQYSFMAIVGPDQWPLATLLYVVSYITYGATLVFYAAIFPRLAKFMPDVREAREDLLPAGKITVDEYNKLESLSKSHISNISTAHSNIGYFVTLLFNLAILIPLSPWPYANNLALLATTTYFLLLGIPWFIYRQSRPGPPLPKHQSHLTTSLSHLRLALRSLPLLRQTTLYLIAIFLLSDALNTTSTLLSLLQNQTIHFSFLTLTYLGLTQAVFSTLSTFLFDHIQTRFRMSPKPFLQLTCLFTLLVPLYGSLSLFDPDWGYASLSHFVAYNVVFGLFQAPYYAYAQTLMAELSPPGYEGVFFGLFGTMQRASSVVGPNVLFAITEMTGEGEWGFVFLSVLAAGAMALVALVDVRKGKEDCEKFVEGMTGVHRDIGRDLVEEQDDTAAD